MLLATSSSVQDLLSWLWGGSSLMDTLNTLLLGWLFSAVLILILAKFLYDKFLRGNDEEDLILAAATSKDGATSSTPSPDGGLAGSKAKRGEERKVPTIIPKAELIKKGSASPAAGQDADAVRWINTIMKWMYRGPHKAVSGPYLSLLNDMTVQTALETGVLIEVLEILPATPSPTLSNIVVDCFPNDAMNITCDCRTSLFLRLQTTRTQGDVTSENEYVAVVDPFIGRVNADLQTAEQKATLKFDGWPEVLIEMENIRNNEDGLREKELQEVVKDVLSSAIRTMVLNLNMTKESTFPPFKRSRELPDKVMPVGYDSMVRERQTHPPILKSKGPPPKPREIPSVSLGGSKKESSTTVLEDLGYDVLKPVANSLLTQNVRATDALNSSEERLINRNVSEFQETSLQYDASLLEDNDDAENLSQQGAYDKNYVPPGFLEQVTAVALAKASQRSLAEMKSSQSSQEQDVDAEGPSDKSKDIPLLDYIPYDSEYEEDEDFDDYLEKKSAPSKPPVLLSPFERQPVKPKQPAPVESKRAPEETFPSKQSPTTATMATGGGLPKGPDPPVLGAMGLPHHPKSHFAQTLAPAPPPPGLAILNGKRLLVKIVKATGVGCEKGSVAGYVVVEMDEPAQRFTTSVVKGSNSPFWDQQFLFDLSDSTLELLFEIYDETDSQFLGLGIVGIEELVATPSQRQIIPLQARPYEDDVVSGSLTVEFLFLEGGDIPELSVRKGSAITQRSPQTELPGVTITNSTTYSKSLHSQDVLVNGKANVAEAVLRDIADKALTNSQPANKSTIIIHASKKPEDDSEQIDEGEDSDDNYIVNTLQYPFPDGNTTTIGNKNTTTNAATSDRNTSSSDALLDEPPEIEDDARGRSRNKKKSFFGTLKKRFGRSKQRSQSVEPTAVQQRESTPTDAPRTATVGRSVSMERSARLRPTGLLSVPKADGATRSDTGSTRSSLSETSGLSSSSTRTYVNEASMLIVETVENGVIKHYLVPVSLQQRNKWRKRGTKLHVFSGHTFVAKHISSSVKCSVCEKSFNRRPGKQGYECRDCNLVTHKPCHVRTEVQCPNSKVNNMDLVYIKDPREERRSQRKSRD